MTIDNNLSAECRDCRFWSKQGGTGKCRRYPAIVRKDADDGCGEFKLPELLEVEVPIPDES